jgi:hypothetical protein
LAVCFHRLKQGLFGVNFRQDAFRIIGTGERQKHWHNEEEDVPGHISVICEYPEKQNTIISLTFVCVFEIHTTFH